MLTPTPIPIGLTPITVLTFILIISLSGIRHIITILTHIGSILTPGMPMVVGQALTLQGFRNGYTSGPEAV